MTKHHITQRCHTPAAVCVEQLCHQKCSEFFIHRMLCVFPKHGCAVWCELSLLCYTRSQIRTIWEMLAVNVVSGLWDEFWFILLFKCPCSQSRLPFRDLPGCVFPSWIHTSMSLIVLSITGVFQCSCSRFDTHIAVTPNSGIFSATWSLNAWDWKLGLLNKRREPSGICRFYILFVWVGTRFVVLILDRIKDFSTKLNCGFFLHFIAMVCIFQLITTLWTWF